MNTCSLISPRKDSDIFHIKIIRLQSHQKQESTNASERI